MHLDQIRARRAFESVRGDAGLPRDDFLTLARKLPVMLQTNGLLATWAHLLAKNEPEHRAALKILTKHFQDLGLPLAGERPDAVFERWVGSAQGLSSRELRRWTAEAIEFSVWLKRAAEALCDVKPAAPGAAP
jgi:CRISPR/Cas system CMR-associated protein Cmr5 small subunit